MGNSAGQAAELGDDDVRHVALGHLHLSGAAQDGKPNATLAAAHFERAAELGEVRAAPGGWEAARLSQGKMPCILLYHLQEAKQASSSILKRKDEQLT